VVDHDSNAIPAALSASPEVAQLLRSPGYRKALGLLEGKRRHGSYGLATSLELWVVRATTKALAQPDIAETMTATERRKFAANVKETTTRLWDSIGPFLGEDGRNWPFQPVFDRLALDVSIDDEERWRDNYTPDEVEEMSHRSRFAIYHLLMNRLDWLLEAIDEAAEWVATSETILKKPNDPNAKRLYFLRQITRAFVSEFGSPCRAAALELATVFFDCSDLNEAAISKLAPVVKPKPFEISAAEFEGITARMEASIETFASKSSASPDDLQELRDNLKKMRESAYKVQLNEAGK